MPLPPCHRHRAQVYGHLASSPSPALYLFFERDKTINRTLCIVRSHPLPFAVILLSSYSYSRRSNSHRWFVRSYNITEFGRCFSRPLANAQNYYTYVYRVSNSPYNCLTSTAMIRSSDYALSLSSERNILL